LSDSSKTCGVTTDDEDFSGWNLSGGRRLARKEPPKVIGGLHDSSVKVTNNDQLLLFSNMNINRVNLVD